MTPSRLYQVDALGSVLLGHVQARDFRAQQLGDNQTGRIVRATVDT